MKRVVVGISGATGAIYGIRLLEMLSKAGIETHLVLTDAARKTILMETDRTIEEVKALADVNYDNRNCGADIASGSFQVEGMVVIPCSIKSLSAIANSYNDSLLVRAADVTLKEKRRLIVVVRETPLHKGHLELMTRVADYGGTILPPFPAFYFHPNTIDDIINHTVGKVFDGLGMDHQLFDRWGSDVVKETLKKKGF